MDAAAPFAFASLSRDFLVPPLRDLERELVVGLRGDVPAALVDTVALPPEALERLFDASLKSERERFSTPCPVIMFDKTKIQSSAIAYQLPLKALKVNISYRMQMARAGEE